MNLGLMQVLNSLAEIPTEKSQDKMNWITKPTLTFLKNYRFIYIYPSTSDLTVFFFRYWRRRGRPCQGDFFSFAVCLFLILVNFDG